MVCRHREDFDLLGLRLLQVLHQCGKQLTEPAFASERDELLEVARVTLKSNENLIVIPLCWLFLVHRLPPLIGQDRRYRPRWTLHERTGLN